MKDKEVNHRIYLLNGRQYLSDADKKYIHFISNALDEQEDFVFLDIVYLAFDDLLKIDPAGIKEEPKNIDMWWNKYGKLFKKHCENRASFKKFEKKYFNPAMRKYFDGKWESLYFRFTEETLNLFHLMDGEYQMPISWIKALKLDDFKFKKWEKEIVIPQLTKDSEEIFQKELISIGLEKKNITQNKHVKTNKIELSGIYYHKKKRYEELKKEFYDKQGAYGSVKYANETLAKEIWKEYSIKVTPKAVSTAMRYK